MYSYQRETGGCKVLRRKGEGSFQTASLRKCGMQIRR